ncbi:LysE family translocator [Novosphingobium sp. Leaf2]|uniref:LysE family translocator n=1 Tax=Novosphingobium sp. Leaf2 TaxID=1735670 RepID=UPI0007020CA5|nr:LysE family translocator [Novosphingobium sp. Leaf2]KQM21604.1 amino acid transporter [Novosphingobium sp. Leaf2]
MTLHTWWLFVGVVFMVCGTPGPNMLHVLSRSVEYGARASVVAMAGCLSAILLLMSASAAGLTTLLLAVPGSFEVLRWAGVAYLTYLGVKAWRSPVAAAPDADRRDRPPAPRRPSAWVLYRGGFAIAISNPKAILFAAAFFPQFIDPAAPKPAQFAILLGTFSVVETGWYCVYALGGRSLARHLARPAVKRAFNRLTGAVFVGFGLALINARPA